jgi:hypothetical protein
MKKNEKNPKIRRQKTFDLTVTRFELLHIRDLFSVLLPPNGDQTLSQSLADLEGRKLIESMLWEKITALCEAADLPVDAEAPDYIIAPTTSPTLGVFHVNHNLEEEPAEAESGFLPEDAQEEQEDDEDTEE